MTRQLSRIEQARSHLQSVLADQPADPIDFRLSIQAALDLLERKPYCRTPSPIRSAQVTPAMMEQVKHMAQDRPDASQAQIAHEFNINPGRVSEILSGKRDPETGDML